MLRVPMRFFFKMFLLKTFMAKCSPVSVCFISFTCPNYTRLSTVRAGLARVWFGHSVAGQYTFKNSLTSCHGNTAHLAERALAQLLDNLVLIHEFGAIVVLNMR